MKTEILLYLEVSFTLLCSICYTWAMHHFCTRHFICIRSRRNLFLLLLAAAPPVVTWLRLYCLLHDPGVSGTLLSLEDWFFLRTLPQPAATALAMPFYLLGSAIICRT